ncbi:MAG: lysine--tRNA ligase [Chloroflexi bacterium]|nr:lysine--tRNA ligase [Chloroflexota bacterium]
MSSSNKEKNLFGEQKLIDDRIKKIDSLKSLGIDPYPARFCRTHTTEQAINLFSKMEKNGKESSLLDSKISLSGRVMSKRDMGSVCFIDIKDVGGIIQIFSKKDQMKENYSLIDYVDIGDIIGVNGVVFKTRRGQISIDCQELSILTKSIRPLPDKWGGLSDHEVRFRQKYLDLISNPQAMKNATIRSNVVRYMREFMHEKGYIEVETPILVPVAAGAQATPFETYHNQLSEKLYLRIATELYLKKLIVGGIEKVFEIGRLFRNEGLDHNHNPEFTTIESYEAYSDYNDVMDLVENMVSFIAKKINGSMIIKSDDKNVPDIDLTPPWKRLDLRKTLIDKVGIDYLKINDRDSLEEKMKELKIHVDENATWGRLLDKVISSTIEPDLIQPHFLVDYPIEMSPLAKKKPGSEKVVERFEAFVMGSELANAFSELNDPIDQRKRFEDQEKMRAVQGDLEADRLDEDFLVAIEHGMPPTGGLGLGVDRLTMLLSGESSIREILLFPAMRKQ